MGLNPIGKTCQRLSVNILPALPPYPAPPKEKLNKLKQLMLIFYFLTIPLSFLTIDMYKFTRDETKARLKSEYLDIQRVNFLNEHMLCNCTLLPSIGTEIKADMECHSQPVLNTPYGGKPIINEEKQPCWSPLSRDGFLYFGTVEDYVAEKSYIEFNVGFWKASPMWATLEILLAALNICSIMYISSG